MVHLGGFEPPAHGLEVRCSILLSYRCMERVKGIEPSQPAWKAGALPLSYTRMLFLTVFADFISITSLFLIVNIFFHKLYRKYIGGGDLALTPRIFI